jgi:hypothetical protein
MDFRDRTRIAACSATLALLAGFNTLAGEEDEIVTGCHFSNAEWGPVMIDRCIKDNLANRALVMQYPEKYKEIVGRCRLKNEYGWGNVKACIDRDIEADEALASYPKEKSKRIATCSEEFGLRGRVVVKACVDGAADDANFEQE